MGGLTNFDWNKEAFEKLVMDEQLKTLVRSLVQQHSSDQSGGFDDIISGKGKGLIGMFSGPPGSGKTLTAEAVAEITKRPLYSVSAGELGVDPKSVDENLTKILELAHRWNAVLLLDEADVFLQQRDTHDVNRNALVSIFLRQLEYFQGILILTTNRIAHCDPAFASRIHISLNYPDLDAGARETVWRNFLGKAKGAQGEVIVDLSDMEIHELAKVELNGRQVSLVEKTTTFFVQLLTTYIRSRTLLAAPVLLRRRRVRRSPSRGSRLFSGFFVLAPRLQKSRL